MKKQIKTQDGHRTTGIMQFYEKLPEHIVPMQKTIPPYLPVMDGYFGYQGVLLHDQLLDRVQCHICGRWLKCLSAHIRIHDIDHISYKDRFGLYRSEPLARLSTLHKWEIMNKRKKQAKNLLGKRQPLTTENRRASITARQKDQWKNKYGTCEAQLRFRLSEAVKKYGEIPTSKTNEGQNLRRTFKRRFGSWKAGLEHYKNISVE